MRGRKPKPTHLHKLTGTFRKGRHGCARAGEPVANGALIDPPAWMTSQQQEIWTYAIAHAPAGLVKMIDASILAVWVVAYDQHRVAAEQQAKIDAGNALPLLSRDKDGLAVASPYIGVMNRAGLRLMKAASELGFTPACRPRIADGATALEEDASPWSRFSVIRGGRMEPRYPVGGRHLRAHAVGPPPQVFSRIRR